MTRDAAAVVTAASVVTTDSAVVTSRAAVAEIKNKTVNLCYINTSIS